MKFPDFIIIGAPKCGTTPLWFSLDKHPDITMIPRSPGHTEMHFWGKQLFKSKGVDWYKSLFHGKICGEKTPGYWIRKNSMVQIKQYIPDVKLIMCVRHPTERAYSNYKMNVKSRKVPGTFTENLFLKRYFDAGQYMKHLNANVLSIFKKEQLHISVTEWMKKDTVNEMNKIYKFLELPNLNIEARVIDPKEKPWTTGDMEEQRKESWYRVWDQYSETVTGELRTKINNYYKEQNERMFDFLGYEISEWKL